MRSASPRPWSVSQLPRQAHQVTPPDGEDTSLSAHLQPHELQDAHHHQPVQCQQPLHAAPLLLTVSAGCAQVQAVEESLQGVAAQGEAAAAATAALQQQLAARDGDLARAQASLRGAEVQLSAATDQREDADRRAERCGIFWRGYCTSTCDICGVLTTLPHRGGAMPTFFVKCRFDLLNNVIAGFVYMQFSCTAHITAPDVNVQAREASSLRN